jgi:hypothetical protein
VVENDCLRAPSGYVFFSLKTKTKLFSDIYCALKNWMVDEVLKKNDVSFNFSHALFSFLEFLAIKEETG